MNDNIFPHNRVKVAFGRFVLWLLGGWKIEGQLPSAPRKYVIIVAHHTSNWDFIVGVGVKLTLRLKARFFAKHSLFIWPLGLLMRSLGGSPIERSKSSNRVEQAVKEIEKSDHFVLVIAPEGTRSKVKRWKTGFYHIATGAGIPVVPVAFDFKNRKVVLGAAIPMSGNVQDDFQKMHRFFLPYPGRHPELSCNEPCQNPEVYEK